MAYLFYIWFMESFGILGFVFGVSALAMVLEMKKTVKSLQDEVTELKNK
tara:strand:- start:219 stop:365 length:147 start_codon:yes stop_codon:yes gene_type:complete